MSHAYNEKSKNNGRDKTAWSKRIKTRVKKENYKYLEKLKVDTIK